MGFLLPGSKNAYRKERVHTAFADRICSEGQESAPSALVSCLSKVTELESHLSLVNIELAKFIVIDSASKNEIAVLKRTKAQLIKKISSLESKQNKIILSQGNKISYLKDVLSTHGNEISYLKDVLSTHGNEISYLKDVVLEISTEREFWKFVTAMQDLNAFYKLEIECKGANDSVMAEALTRIREARVAQYHFILNGNTADNVSQRAVELLKKMKTMSDSCRREFANSFGDGFLDNFAFYVTKQIPSTTVSTQSNDPVKVLS